jgi:hypothetical protein
MHCATLPYHQKNHKIGKEVEESKVEALFELFILKNGYKYSFSDDEKLISSVETLWMVTHQRTQVPSSRLINNAEAHEIVYEKKGKQVN